MSADANNSVMTVMAAEPNNPHARNLTISLIERARTHPDTQALLLPGLTLNYQELDRLVWRFALRLHDQGLNAGDVLGLAFSSQLALVLTLLGAIRLGATAFSIPLKAAVVQQQDMVEQAQVTMVATDQSEPFGTWLRAPVTRVDATWNLAPLPTDTLFLLARNPEAPWLLMTGSGSTGEPKLIPLTHGQSQARAKDETAALQLTSSDRIGSLSPFDFAASKCRLHEAFLAGASISLQAWNPTDPIGHIQRQGLSVVYATVFHAEALLKRCVAGAGPALPSVRVLELTSSTVSMELRQRIRHALTPNLHVLYGINEAGPVSIAYPSEAFAIPGTVGKPLPGLLVQVVDEREQPVQPGTIGLIRIRSPGLVLGYRGNPAATDRCFKDGWFTPGDLGRFMADGSLIYCGRADHMMIMNGINIYPAEIEQVLSTHPDVHDVAAMPVRHPVHQDVPVCAVALYPGARSSEADLLEWARGRLGPRGPRRVVIVESIPRNHDGKLVRAELRDRIERRLREPINR